jgi:hypothetical protein
MFPSSVLSVFSPGARSSTSQTKQHLLTVLCDDSVQILSSLELNQWATLTYHEERSGNDEDLCECLFATLADVLQRPLQYSPLAMLKALVVAKHMLLLGADRVVHEGRVAVGPATAALKENYNTALLAQQQTGATGFFMRLKGGSVDQGGPVREAAEQLYILLTNPGLLQHERAVSADPRSLVPVGSRDTMAFCTDEMRLHALRQQIQKQTQIKSNLQKAEDGFGSGYNSKDGKSVVGAAHSLDEMLQHAQRQEQQFSDDTSKGNNKNSTASAAAGAGFSEYQAPTVADFLSSDGLMGAPPYPAHGQTTSLYTTSSDYYANPPPIVDLLSLTIDDPSALPSSAFSGQQQKLEDLLGFSSPSTTTGTTGSQCTSDFLLSLSMPIGTTAPPTAASSISGLYSGQPHQQHVPAMSKNGLMAAAPPIDPFASLTASPSTSLGLSSMPTVDPYSVFGSLNMQQHQPGATTTTTPFYNPVLPLASSQLKVSKFFAPVGGSEDETTDVMGGPVGSGLQYSMTRAPSAPPPPPPSDW